MEKTVRIMLAIAILIDVAYWSIWFTNRDWLASEHRAAYYEFENAFPLADAWLGLACLLAFIGLWRGWASATYWCICAGSAGLYLFGMDFLYDVENGIFTSGGGGAIEAAIVAMTLIFSLTLLTFGWKRTRDA